jgi:hypothetical protein
MPRETQPDKARLAKLLRLATNHATTDGERLTALGKLSAFAKAHYLDWDQLLSGNAADLTRAQLSRVYAAGVETGVQAEREARGAAADWRPAGLARTDEVGPRARELKAILDAAEAATDDGYLDGWFAEFGADMRAKLARFGASTFVSERQWEAIERLRARLEFMDFYP